VSAEVEQLVFKQKTGYLSELEAVLNSNSCHSAYIQCFGPSFIAFEEIFALIDLHSTEGAGSPLIFTETEQRENIRIPKAKC
jgi:hypothetical protein